MVSIAIVMNLVAVDADSLGSLSVGRDLAAVKLGRLDIFSIRFDPMTAKLNYHRAARPRGPLTHFL